MYRQYASCALAVAEVVALWVAEAVVVVCHSATTSPLLLESPFPSRSAQGALLAMRQPPEPPAQLNVVPRFLCWPMVGLVASRVSQPEALFLVLLAIQSMPVVMAHILAKRQWVVVERRATPATGATPHQRLQVEAEVVAAMGHSSPLVVAVEVG